MKKLLLPACLALLIFSCKDPVPSGPNNNNNPVITSYLSSIWDYSASDTTIDSFSYSAGHNLATFAQYDYEPGVRDSAIATFSFNGTDTIPDAYIFNVSGQSASHQLFYDGQGRIIKDTATDGSDFVVHFVYGTNTITSTVLFDGTTNDDEVVTVTTSNGNMTHVSATAGGSTIDALYGYSTYANPAYYPAVAKSIAPLLLIQSINTFGTYQDCISQKIAVSLNGTTAHITTDGSGRVISGAVPGTGDVENFYYY
jgi:hypothetical protein